MKLSSKINRISAKYLLAGFCMSASLFSFAQQRSVIADPHLGAITLTDISGYQINEEFVQPGQLIKLRIPVANVNHGKILPAGSCKIKIGFGSKLQLDPEFDLSTAEMSDYFKWTASMNGGQLQITGDLISPLPVNLDEVNVSFKVKGSVEGRSTITANYLISNHNTATIVSDEDGTNNSAFLHYTVTNRPAPVSKTNIAELSKIDCSVNVAFATDREINLVRYEVEVSNNGSAFEKVATISAANNLSYTTSFVLSEGMQVQQLLVRIKSIDRNGSFVYSDAKVVNGMCIKLPLRLNLYPNPAKGFMPLTISATQGIFDGKYKVKMMDIAGKTVVTKDITLHNVPNFQFDFGNIAAGKYLIQVANSENEQVGLLKFEKF